MQWFSIGVGEVGTLPSGEHLAMSGDIFDRHSGEGGGAPGFQWVEARDAAKHPTIQ